MNHENKHLLHRLMNCTSSISAVVNLEKNQETQHRLLNLISQFDEKGNKKVPMLTTALLNKKRQKINLSQLSNKSMKQN